MKVVTTRLARAKREMAARVRGLNFTDTESRCPLGRELRHQATAHSLTMLYRPVRSRRSIRRRSKSFVCGSMRTCTPPSSNSNWCRRSACQAFAPRGPREPIFVAVTSDLDAARSRRHVELGQVADAGHARAAAKRDLRPLAMLPALRAFRSGIPPACAIALDRKEIQSIECKSDYEGFAPNRCYGFATEPSKERACPKVRNS